MPWRLFGYILGDLLRVVALVSVVLVTVVAFGATIKPLANANLISAAQTARYLILVTVPMLQFALPFAAGFAATMSLHRMTNDNEILAAAVGGISYRRLLAPIAGLGVVLTLVMVLLTQWVIPQFWGLMEQTIARDVTKIFQASLQRGDPFDLGDLQIYADRLRVDEAPEPEEDPSGPAPDTRLYLEGVAAAELDKEGKIAIEVTAEAAVIDIYRREDGTVLNLALINAVAFKEQEGALARLSRVEHTLRVPRVFEDDARAMTRSQLLRLRERPDEYGPVIEARDDLAAYLRDLDHGNWIDLRLRSEGQVEFIEPGTAGRRFVVHANGLKDGRFLASPGEELVIEQFQGTFAVRRFAAENLSLARGDVMSLEGSRFKLLLRGVEVSDLQRGGPANPRRHLTLAGLSVSGLPEDDPAAQTSDELLQRAQAVEDPEPELLFRQAKLREEHRSIQTEITSRLWKRYALSATAFLLLTLGATLAMWLRESLPLTIYLWSFAPSVLDLIVISGGEQVMRDSGIVAGFVVMWSGNVVLAVLLICAYLRLARH
ncbi:MAG: LptF/LptG family permease [Phycisphaerales bacterium]|nr:MAG: LptF/LptG family permease [Phycisphaerales bacterium]